ncbi:MAG: hypothetical protein EZS28_002875 [Streblomastix strix]|uniref:Uncharacterized protein n=1 Tax=Streblomastix strix TaxID=222440 RepID=A0A5J4X315_9EUKA|nr:MAG: hypothetical protein EZS28_002875 [Streblomastix strix]
MELNCEAKTLHFFIDGVQQLIFVHGINEPVKFFIYLYGNDTSFTVTSVKELKEATAKDIPGQKCQQPTVDLNAVQVVTSSFKAYIEQAQEKKQKNQIFPARKRYRSPSENSSSDYSAASGSYALTDDDIVHNKQRKIIGDSESHQKPLDYKFSASRINKNIRAVERDKIDFPTADSTPKLEGLDDEDNAEYVILSAVTTRSVLLMANVAAESPETRQKLKKPILRTIRLSQQTITDAQTAREFLVLNEKANISKQQHHLQELSVTQSLKTWERGANQRKTFLGVARARLDLVIARQETQSQQEHRIEPRNSQMCREIRRNMRETNEIPGSMDSNWNRKTGDDGNNTSLDERKQQTNLQKNFTSDTTQWKPASISSSSLKRILSESRYLNQFTLYQTLTPAFCIHKRDISYRKIHIARVTSKQTKKIHSKMISPFDVQDTLLQISSQTSIDIKFTFIYITVYPPFQPYL